MRYRKWCERFDALDHEMRALYHNRHIWKNLRAMAERVATPEDHGIARAWVDRGYVSVACLGVRRLNDSDQRTASLRQVLDIARRSPTLISRSVWEREARARASSAGISETYLRDRVLPGYARFADPSGDVLDPDKLQADLDALGTATETVKRYADTNLAHVDFQRGPAVGALTFGGLDQAITDVGQLYRKYYGLRHPGTELWHLTPVLPMAWLRAFEQPWWTPELEYIEEEALG